MKFLDRFKNSWNVFRNAETENVSERPMYISGGGFSGRRPDRKFFGSAKSSDVINAIYTRISIDAANVAIEHVVLDDNKRYSSTQPSGLNDCLNFEANIDQDGRAFRQDIFYTMLEEGNAIIVPVTTDVDPDGITTFDIQTMRVGTDVAWYPQHILTRLYDDRDGIVKELLLPKTFVAPVENPFYSVMNEPNGTLKRLVRKINLLDAVDEMIGSGQLDLIIQLPYIVKTDTKREQAEKRREELESQLRNSSLGIGYIDGTERITQLNRPVENSLLKNVEYLTNMLHTQLGITESVMNGTASEEEMMHYQIRTIKPLLDAVVGNLARKYLTKNARTRGHAIKYYQDPLALMPPSKFAEFADKLTRNAILSSNEVRDHLGRPPVDDPIADALVNKNLPQDPIDPLEDSDPQEEFIE